LGRLFIALKGRIESDYGIRSVQMIAFICQPCGKRVRKD